MSDLVRVQSRGLAGRQQGRTLAAVGKETSVRAARVEAKTFVAYSAMQAVAMIGVLEGELIKSVPVAEPRLKMIADAHSFGVADEVMRPW